MKTTIATLAATTALALGSAQAALLDFTDASLIDGTPSSPVTVTVGGVDVTITASPDALNFNDTLDNPGAPFCSTFGFACEQDGLGIVNDELDGSESVTLAFSNSVNISALSFLDLFFDTGSDSDETVTFFVNGDTAGTFDGLDPFRDDANGFSRFTTDLGMVDSISFLVGGGNDGVGVGDFALAGIEFTPVPLPAAGLLFATAVAGAGVARRRRAA